MDTCLSPQDTGPGCSPPGPAGRRGLEALLPSLPGRWVTPSAAPGCLSTLWVAASQQAGLCRFLSDSANQGPSGGCRGGRTPGVADGAVVSPVPGLELALRSPGCLWMNRGWRMSKGGPGGRWGGELYGRLELPKPGSGWRSGGSSVLFQKCAHKSPFWPKPLGTLGWEGGGPLAAPPGDVAGIEVRDLSRVPRKC